MKKSLIIIVLAFLQGACAVPRAPLEPASLRSFEAIGSEISLSREKTPDGDDLSEVVAMNP